MPVYYLNLAEEASVCQHSIAVVSDIKKCLQDSMQWSASISIDGSPETGFGIWGLVGGYAYVWMISKPKCSQAAPVLSGSYKLHIQHT